MTAEDTKFAYHLNYHEPSSESNFASFTMKANYVLDSNDCNNFFSGLNHYKHDCLDVVEDRFFDTRQTNIHGDFLPSYFESNFEILQQSYMKEYAKYGHHLTVSAIEAKSIFNELSILFAEFPFEKAIVELTLNNSFKFSFEFHDKLLIVNKPIFKLVDVGENEIIFSLFINKEFVASNVSKPKPFVEGFKKFLAA